MLASTLRIERTSDALDAVTRRAPQGWSKIRCFRDLVRVNPCLVTVLRRSFDVAMAVTLIDVSVVEPREPGIPDPFFENHSRVGIASTIAKTELDRVEHGLCVARIPCLEGPLLLVHALLTIPLPV